MPIRPETVCLIIPCLNERERLAQNAGRLLACPYKIIFVDDGSSDGTADWIRLQNQPRWQVITLSRNQGKAEAVRQGMQHIQTRSEFQSLLWIGYWDADLSTLLEEVQTMLAYQDLLYPQAQVIFGSRLVRLGSHIQRSFRRHFFGRFFATVVGLLFPKLGVYDSQCGAKLLKRDVIEQAFSVPFVSRWLFDLEILLRLTKVSVVEYPLTSWEEKGGSKLNLFSNAPRIALDLYRLKKTYR